MEGLVNEAVLSFTGQKLYHLVFFLLLLLSINSARKDNLEINECRIRVSKNKFSTDSFTYILTFYGKAFFFKNGLNT